MAKAPACKTLKSLAALLGISYGSARSYSLRDDWTFANPYDPKAVRAWLDERDLGRPRSDVDAAKDAIDETITRAEAERLRAIEDAALKRIKRQQLEGTLIPVDDYVQVLQRYTSMIRLKIEEMVDSMPPLLQRRTTGQIRETLERWYDRLCSDMSSVVSVTIGEPDPEKTPVKKNPAKRRAAAARFKTKRKTQPKLKPKAKRKKGK